VSRLLRQAANRLWNLSLQRDARAFWESLGNMERTQEGLLLEMLRDNSNSEYGRKYGFSRIRTAREFQDAVPLAGYDDFKPYIDRICTGETGLLTSEPVLLLEPTGGSSGGSKLIPCTAGLKKQFQRGIAPWIVDLHRNYPGLLNGASYWSVSPVARQQQVTTGGIPIGFDDDSGYVGGLGRLLVASVQAVPARVRHVGQMESFWYVTLLFLLRNRDLSLISVWNPSFLAILCGHLQTWWPMLVDDMGRGALTPPVPLDSRIAGQLKQGLLPDPVRAGEVRAAYLRSETDAKRLQAIWPRLRLISCWCDGAAGSAADELRQLFPQVTIQGKGLIATEGFFTLPRVGLDGCLPAVRSHFMEFIPTDGGDARLLHQLEGGGTYSLVVTTAGGLYRYRLHDQVRVTGFHGNVPLLRFIGKEDHISDVCGEKLHETHVADVLRRVAARHTLQTRFAMLACELLPVPGYVCYIESESNDDGRLTRLAPDIDDLLRENFHYAYCRDLGQLMGVRIFRIDRGGSESCLDACCRRGQRLGDVKPLTLQRGSGWTDEFQGRML